MTSNIAVEPRLSTLLRWCLLGLILLAFGRVTWQLDAKNFWWDETLSLQRAEEDWLALVRGELVLKDGFTNLMTIDQHPFFSFLLQGILVRLAGESEFVLRFPAAMAATLLTPALWVMARRLVQQRVVPPSTPSWVALLAAVNPFYLWYGQEARPYIIWALLAVLSTYLLMRSLARTPLRPRHLVGYGVSLIAFLATHYYAVFLIPLHALIVFQYVARKNLWRALSGALAISVIGAAAAGIALWQLIRPAAGSNMAQISLGMLVPDLLNAFSMGLSVDINMVWWLDLIFGALALLGVVWMVRSKPALTHGGWIAPLFVAIPVTVLLVLNAVRPAYMNARHLSLISGGFLLLVGSGLGVLTLRQRWLAVPVALVLVAGAGYSTNNYFALPQYDKDHFVELGQYLTEQLLPGDLLLLNPPSSWRLFRYYLPLDALDQAQAANVPVAYAGMPLLRRSWEDTYAQLEQFRRQYRRIWHANSGTHPYFDPDNQVEAWLNEHAKQFRRERFFSPNSVVALDLYLPDWPWHEGPPTDLPIQHRLTATFGEHLQLVGYDLAPPLAPGFPIPVTLYWQVITQPARSYKYILRLVETGADGQVRELPATERAPYDGQPPTFQWVPNVTFIDDSQLPAAPLASTPADNPYQLSVQIYDAETLEKLPVQLTAGDGTTPDAQTLRLPFPTLAPP
jgi:mannosyltransferase